MADTIEVVNPQFSGQEFGDPETVAVFDSTDGVLAKWAQLRVSGEFKPRTLVFPAERFGSREQCEAWLAKRQRALRAIPAGHHATRMVDVVMEEGYGPRPSGDDLELINRYALEPLSAEQVYVRRMRLMHDGWHSDFQRFSRSVLQQLNDTIIGKSLLEGHDYNRAGIGRFFRSELQRDDAQGRTYSVCYFYMVGQPEKQAQIDAGVWSYTSIGFMWDWVQCDICGENYMSADCPHWLGEAYPLDDLPAGADLDDKWLTEDSKQVYCTVTYRGKAESVEGSIVYLGALPGAEIVRGLHGGVDLLAAKRAALGLPEPTALQVSDMGERPYPTEHACRLEDPGQYTRFISQDGDIDGKPVRNIIGYKSDGESERQAIRFPVESWDADSARTACRSRGGQFEAASGGSDAGDSDGQPRGSSEPDPTVGDAQGNTPEAKEAGKLMADEIAAKLAEVEGKLAETQAAADKLTADLEGKAAEVTDLQAKFDKVTEAEAALRAHEVAELDRLAGLTGNATYLLTLREAWGEDLAGAPVDKLLALQAEWLGKLDEHRPAQQSTLTETDPPGGDADADPDSKAGPPVDYRESRLT